MCLCHVAHMYSSYIQSESWTADNIVNTGSIVVNVLYHAVAPMDYIGMDTTLEFDECDTKHCVNVTVSNDVTLELVESFFVTLEWTVRRPIFNPILGEIKIMDDRDECEEIIIVY